jgi:hypothetical protein
MRGDAKGWEERTEGRAREERREERTGVSIYVASAQT